MNVKIFNRQARTSKSILHSLNFLEASFFLKLDFSDWDTNTRGQQFHLAVTLNCLNYCKHSLVQSQRNHHAEYKTQILNGWWSSKIKNHFLKLPFLCKLLSLYPQLHTWKTINITWMMEEQKEWAQNKQS